MATAAAGGLGLGVVVVSQDGSRRVLRRVRDWVQDCELACRSDVSPSDLKLLVLEDGDKHIIRGQKIIPRSGGHAAGVPGVPEPQASAWPRNAYPAAASRSGRALATGRGLPHPEQDQHGPPLLAGFGLGALLLWLERRRPR